MSTCNNECNRGCWSNGLDALSNWETKWPITGKTNIYELELTEVDEWVGPYGVVKHGAMLINGGFPGPALRGDWGDRFDVIVTNKLRYNGTSMHWHGVHLWNNNINDGASGMTECPIPLGETKNIHSSRPSTDHLGITRISLLSTQMESWAPFKSTVLEHTHTTPTSASSPLRLVIRHYRAHCPTHDGPQNPYIAGSPYYLVTTFSINPADPGGEYAKVTLKIGKRYRLRLINPSADNTFTISVVGHKMTVRGRFRAR